MSANLDHLQAATLSLTRATPIKERITDAYCNHLAYVDESQLPLQLSQDFRALTDYLTREQPLIRGDDAVRATIRKLSNDEAAAVASAIVGIFAAASRTTIDRTQAVVSRARSSKKTNVMPFYVSKPNPS